MHFPAKGKPQKADTMDISRVGVSAEEIARWIADRTDIQVKLKSGVFIFIQQFLLDSYHKAP